jgi:hypothetical protein
VADEELDQRIRELVRSAIGATPPPPPLLPSRLHRGRVPALTAVIATLAIVALAITGVALVRDGRHSSVDTRGAESRCREKDPPIVLEGLDVPLSSGPLFEPLPAGPVDGRITPSVVWTGSEAIVWGGELRTDAPELPQPTGAAYSPGKNAWRPIREAPFALRSDHVAAVWTGKEMLVWGLDPSASTEGGAYNPRANRWRRLPRAPVEAASGLVTVWTGKEMIVWGGRANVGAAYNPCTNRWRQVAPSPLEGRFQATAVWTGTEVLVFGGNGLTNLPFLDGAAYNPRRDAWRVIPPAPVRGYYAHSAVWSGFEMIVWGWSNLAADRAAENETVAYDPDDDAWRTLSPAPLVPFPRGQQGEGTGGSVAGWAGDRVLAWTGTLDAEGPLVLEHHPGADTWTRLAPAPAGSQAYVPSIVWTGRELIVFGAGPQGQALALTTRV